MTSAFLTIESSSYLMCLKDSTILKMMYSICRDSPAQLFQVWCGCSCGSRPSSASGHKGDLTPRVWRVTGESPRRVDQARMLQNHPCSSIAISNEAVIARPASVNTGIKVRKSSSSPRVFALYLSPGPTHYYGTK